MYRVSADTTPDVSRKDQMTTICRCVDETGQPRERFLSLKPVTSKKYKFKKLYKQTFYKH